MTEFKGFKTEAEAKAFRKENGGGQIVTKYTKTGRKSSTHDYYMQAVIFGGLNEDKYPYCVLWNED